MATNQAGSIGSLPFRFENFGTFAGPQYLSKNYDFDVSSKEGVWSSQVPGDFSFKNTDVGAYYLNNELNYAGSHLNGVSTASVTIENSYGFLPNQLQLISNTTTIGNENIVGVLNLTGLGNVATFCQTTRQIANSKKSFDIPHPTKENHRLRYVCLEGPEAGVYFRGRLSDSGVINIPEYWKELIDPETITVHLTPHKTYQELFVKSIEWGLKINIQNASGGPINCSYIVHAERRDTPKNIPEYEGLTSNDYPGDNRHYTINGLVN